MEHYEVREKMIDEIEGVCGMLDIPWHLISTCDLETLWVSICKKYEGM